MWCEPIERKAGPAAHDCPPALCGCVSRRSVLRSFSAVAASAALPAPAVWAQGAKPYRIDVHHHFYPPFLQEAWLKAGVRNAPVVQSWRLSSTLDQMDKGGVATAMLSLPTGINLPGVSGEETRRLSREINEYAVKLRSD